MGEDKFREESFNARQSMDNQWQNSPELVNYDPKKSTIEKPIGKEIKSKSKPTTKKKSLTEKVGSYRKRQGLI
jgi:hypothetical protein